MPAVSKKRTGPPDNKRGTSILSLVVPGVGLVMARFVSVNELSKVDFPTFGFPAITTIAPSVNRRPSFRVFKRVYVVF